MSPLERDLEPGKRWTFDEDVTTGFDEMLDRSIPNYRVMRELSTALAAAVVDRSALGIDERGRGQFILDIGCSRGNALAPLLARFPEANFVGLEISQPMLAAARERFAAFKNVEIREWDLRKGLPPYRMATVALSILTLMFVPMERRLGLIQKLHDGLYGGGALVVVEKIIGGSARLDSMFVDQYYAMKAANGYTQEEIERKRLALEGVLVPMPARWNEEMLRLVGFREVDCFWRWANFAGWIAIRD